MIVFAPDVFGGLEPVSAAGGDPSNLSAADQSKQQTSQRWPVFLPDGRQYLYWAGTPLNSGQVQTDGIYVASLDEATPGSCFRPTATRSTRHPATCSSSGRSP